MSKIRILAVGNIGVGKSTIGNCFVGGKPSSNIFKTSDTSAGCTQEAQWSESDNCLYCDVPGFPNYDGPGRTKDVYDIIIKEARKELSVILFVFKWGRIDESIYERVKMLFDELKKTKAAKVLIINDMSNYGFSECPTEADYQSLADHIKNGTALEFNYVFTFTGNTLVTEVESLKKTLLGCQAYASPNLK